MEIYLPIAGMPVSIVLLLGIGFGTGILSGMFGLGGGFLTTPLLILIGIPPTVAVGSEASHIAASSVSGLVAHARRGNVDLRMGLVLLAGGTLGAVTGLAIFRLLSRLGQIDDAISLIYVVVLGTVGVLMGLESLRALRRHRLGIRYRPSRQTLLRGLPLRVPFRRSGRYMSIVPPVLTGFVVGVLSTIMGVGGGFILVPAMIYLLGVPTQVVVGTSLLQIAVVTTIATFLHAAFNQNVDLLLGLLLLLGAVVGAQVGSRLMIRLRGEQIRFLMAGLVLLVVIMLGVNLVVPPDDPFIVERLP